MENKKEQVNQEVSNTNVEQNIENQEHKKTEVISPMMLNEDEEQKAIDLSAIIPQNAVIQEDNEKINLFSKDYNLKSDGSIVLADIVNDEARLRENIIMPSGIDIKARKDAIKRNQNQKKKINTDVDIVKEKNKKKNQSIMSIVSLIIIAFLVGFYFYYKQAPRDSNFKAKQVRVELGDALPTSKSAYVIPGIGDFVDDMAYDLDTSNVSVDKVGEYPYTVIHNNMRKNGVIIVEDTTAPELEVREVVLTVGESFNAPRFVSNCTDLSGCSYSFEEQDTIEKYTQPGTYTVYVVAKDAYDNKTVKQASLVIEDPGMVKFYVKEDAYDFDKGYQLTQTYEIHFTDFINNSIILNGIYIQIYSYQDQEKYDEAFKEHNGDINYTFDNADKTMTIRERANTIGYNYSRYQDVINYLNTNGFIEQSR